MIRNQLFYCFVVFVFGLGQAYALSDKDLVDHDTMLMDHGGGHMMDFDGGMVMGQNIDTLPMSCKSIEDEVEITVRAGRKYAAKFPGTIFGYDNHEWRVEPCTKITFHFINEDNVRHQFMMHGLPKYIYKSGMFHLEVTGPGKISGTIIVPANDETYLVHCDISQHMEKGMKGQLVVGDGGQALPSIPGLTPYAFPDSYDLDGSSEAGQAVNSVSVDQSRTPPVSSSMPVQPASSVVNSAGASASSSLISGMLVIGVAFGLIGAPFIARKVEGKSKEEIYQSIADASVYGFSAVMNWASDAKQNTAALIKKVSAIVIERLQVRGK